MMNHDNYIGITNSQRTPMGKITTFSYTSHPKVSMLRTNLLMMEQSGIVSFLIKGTF